MYYRNADFGKIRFKCTENELKTCPRIRFSAISLESRGLSARAYKIVKFRHRIPVLYAAHSVGRCVRSACAIPRFAPFVRPARHHAPRTPPPASPRCGDSSSVKTKTWLLCNFFSIRNSLSSPQSGIGLANSRLSALLHLNQRLGRHATIPNRKKVTIWIDFLFLVSRNSFQRVPWVE